jgi:hypothetical protein
MATNTIDVSNRPNQVQLTVAQVQEFFPIPWAKAQENYELNVQCAKEDGEDDPGISPPAKCQWYLQRFDPKHTSPYYRGSLPDFPDYVLHFSDSQDVSWVSGNGSDLAWEGEDWEQ